jgi:beta-lactam-binding protein with PASTA domain
MRFPRFRRQARPSPAARTTVVDEARPQPGAVDEEQYVRPRPPLIWPWLLLLLLLVIGGLAAAYFLTRDNEHHSKTVADVTVPSVVGLRQDVAVHKLNERGLTPRIATALTKSPTGIVIAQNPSAGTEVARHSQVNISVSATQVTRVPTVVGDPTTLAIKRLRAAGLRVQTTRVASSKPAGTVVAQNPGPDSSVAKGSTVSLRVSKGKTTVPSLVGQQESTARAEIRAAGLVTAVFRVPGVEPKGTVTAQKPQAGAKVGRGSKVRINVSTGSQAGSPPPPAGTTTTSAPKTVNVPRVVGLQQAAAQRRLHRAGLGSRVVYVSSSKPSGQVVFQSPPGGTSVRRGTRVRIGVSLGSSATTTVVPNVVGQDQQTATSRLQAAGFTVQVIPTPTSDPSQAGTVIDEQPAGGTRAPQGSTVTIYVGQTSG